MTFSKEHLLRRRQYQGGLPTDLALIAGEIKPWRGARAHHITYET
jgi:hypothetical protein